LQTLNFQPKENSQVSELLDVYRVGAAWFTTAGLFIFVRIALRAPDIFVSVALAALFASLFGFLFPALPEVWSFVVFGVTVYPLHRVYTLYRKQKYNDNNKKER
jgi:hypothetical protein